jgi:hypothetical protein
MGGKGLKKFKDTLDTGNTEPGHRGRGGRKETMKSFYSMVHSWEVLKIHF